jgi:hypothetical protein
MAEDTIRELLVKALKRQDELRSEFEALQNLVAHYQRHLSVSGSAAGEDQPSLDLRLAASSLKARSAYVARLVEEAKRIILEAGRPLKRGELVRLLEREGLPVEGTDKAKVLGTNLWRSGKFEQIEGEGYWPRDVPRPR